MKKLVCAFLSVLLLAAPMAQLAPLAYAEEPSAAVTEQLPEEKPETDPEALPDGAQATVDEAESTGPVDPAADDGETDADVPDKGELSQEPVDAVPVTPVDLAPSETDGETAPAPETTGDTDPAPVYEVSTMELDEPVLLGGAPNSPVTIDNATLSLSTPKFQTRTSAKYTDIYNNKNGCNNPMWVTLSGDTIWNTNQLSGATTDSAKYTFTVTNPDGNEQGVELSPSLDSENTVRQNVARWSFTPTKGGVYIVKMYAKGDTDKTVLASSEIEILRVVFDDTAVGGSKVEYTQESATETYCTDYEFVSFLTWPKLEGALEGQGILHWVLKGTDKKLQNIRKKDENPAGSYTITLQPAVDVVQTYKVGLYTDEECSNSYDNTTPRTVGNGNDKIGYMPASVDPGVLYAKNEGNMPVTLSVTEGTLNKFTMSQKTVAGDDASGPIQPKEVRKLEFRPIAGLGVGTHEESGITLWFSGVRSPYLIAAEFVVYSDNIEITLKDMSKTYGQTLAAENVPFEATSAGKAVQISSLSDLGINITSDGFAAGAGVVNSPYRYKINGETGVQVTVNHAGSTFIVHNPAGTGVMVGQAEPQIKSAKASTLNVGALLDASRLEVEAVNPYDESMTVTGLPSWVNGSEKMTQSGERQYKFTPIGEDAKNYRTVTRNVFVSVSEKKKTTLTKAVDAQTTFLYDGMPAQVDFTARAEDGEERPVTYYFRPKGQADAAWTEGAPIDAGEYDVMVVAPEDDDYAAATEYVDIVVNPKPVKLVVSAEAAAVTKEYDGTVDADLTDGSVTVRETDVVSTDKGLVDVDETAVNAVFDTADAGEGKTVTVTITSGDSILTGTRAANYTIDDSATLSLRGTISKRPITLQTKGGKDLEREYRQPFTLSAADLELAPGSKPLCGDDKLEDFVQVTSGGLRDTAIPAGYAIIVKTDAVNCNYSITSETLAQMLVVVRIAPQPRVRRTQDIAEDTTLKDVSLGNITFENPYSKATIEGTLTWKDPNQTVQEGLNEYECTFKPVNDAYLPWTGKLEVYGIPSVHPPVTLQVTVADLTTVYDGAPHEVRFAVKADETTVTDATVTVLYHYEGPAADIDPDLNETQAGATAASIALTREAELWTETPPVHAGIYSVEAVVGTVTVDGKEYSGNTETATLTIKRAKPNGTVTASEVKIGAYLGDSKLSGEFTGVGAVSPMPIVNGDLYWDFVGGELPSTVPVVDGKEYDWIFLPKPSEDGGIEYYDYCTVSGKAAVNIIPDARVIPAYAVTVYNLPAGTPGGDYAVIDWANVKGQGWDQYLSGELEFYSDVDCTNPVGSVAFSETERPSVAPLDADALNGTSPIYIKVKGSDGDATSIKFDPEPGFELIVNEKTQDADDPIVIGRKQNLEDVVASVIKGYHPESFSWVFGDHRVATYSSAGGSNILTGSSLGGVTVLTVTATIAHPDQTYHQGETIVVSRSYTVIVADGVGALTVGKTVTGTAGETGRDFHFTVTLDNKQVSGTLGDAVFNEGVADFTLHHGQTKEITNIPAGVKYTVTETEANADGYATTAKNAEGVITANETAEVVFTNHRDAPPAPQGSNNGSSNKVPTVDEYIVCEACGHHFWEPYLDGWRCTTCGHLRGTTGVPAAAAKAAQAAYRGSVPQTADESHPALWALLFLASAAGLGITLRARKKRQ